MLDKKGPRKLWLIAREINRDWRPPYFGATPYIAAMHSLETVNDMYGCDTGISIVEYFLSNATSWRGDKARQIKAELKAMCNEYNRARKARA